MCNSTSAHFRDPRSKNSLRFTRGVAPRPKFELTVLRAYNQYVPIECSASFILED